MKKEKIKKNIYLKQKLLILGKKIWEFNKGEGKQVLIGIGLTLGLMIFLHGIIAGFLHYFYFILTLSTYVLPSGFIMVFWILTISGEDILPTLKDRKKRMKVIHNKMFITLSETLIFVVGMLLVLVLIRETPIGKEVERQFMADHPNLSSNPFHLTATTNEWLIIITLFLFSLITLWGGMYWEIGRFARIHGYNQRINRLKVNIPLFILSGVAMLILCLPPLTLDLIFLDIKQGDPYNKWVRLHETVIFDNALIALLLKLGYLFLLTLLFWVDGLIQLKTRTNLVTTQLSDRQEHQSAPTINNNEYDERQSLTEN
ncbi:MAG: hypothetical protein ACTSQE_13970 [Candidatus Heimdallarchaeaceae archaeon]